MTISYVTGAQVTGADAGNVTCAVGDLIIVTAYRDGSTTAPSLPAGFTNIGNAGANTNSERTGYKWATGTTEATGSWTNATKVTAAVYRTSQYAAGWTLFPGATVAGGGASTTVNYPALTFKNQDGTSWAYGAAGHRSTDTAVETAPSGMTNRQATNNTTAEAACHDTNGAVSSWSSTNVSAGGTSSGYRSRVVEIMELPFRILTGGSTNTDGTTQTTASISPSANKLITAHLTSQGVNTSDRTAPSSVGGSNFTLIDEQQVSAYTQASVWRYLNASPFSGTVSIVHPLTQDVVAWTFLEWANADTSGTNGSGAIGTVAKANGTSTSPAPGTISFAGSGAFTLCQTSHTSDSTATVATVTGDADFANCLDQSQTDTSWYAAHNVQLAQTQQAACTPTLSASRTWAAIAFEIVQASGSVSHPSSGALAAQAATVAGSSTHNALHSSSGAMAAQAATVAGSATTFTVHESSGALAAQDAVVAGSATTFTVHDTSGALAAQAATVAGSATRTRQHDSSGAIAAGSAEVAGSAVHLTLHASSGAIEAGVATVAGSATRTRLHDTSGVLDAGSATVAGSANRLILHTSDGVLAAQSAEVAGSSTTFTAHASSGALAAQAANVAGSAARTRVHATDGALASNAATLAGFSTRTRLHDTSGALLAGDAQVIGDASQTSPSTTHGSSGTLVAQDALVAGSALHAVLHSSSGAIAAGSAAITGSASHIVIHDSSGALSASVAAISGAASNPSGSCTEPDPLNWPTVESWTRRPQWAWTGTHWTIQ